MAKGFLDIALFILAIWSAATAISFLADPSALIGVHSAGLVLALLRKVRTNTSLWNLLTSRVVIRGTFHTGGTVIATHLR